MSALETTIDSWITTHFDDEVAFLRELVRVPTDTPPGDNRPHAERTAVLLEAMGFIVERHAPPQAAVDEAGLTSVVNLVVRHRFSADGPVIALNAHGDVVPPGQGWSVPPYDGVIANGRMYGRGVAVSKSDFATYAFALRALIASAEAANSPLRGTIELHFTYDEEFGGLLGPAWLLAEGITKPDLALGPGFSYAVVTAHNGCLQLAVTIAGRSAHAAMPETGVDAIRAAVRVLDALYAYGDGLGSQHSSVAGIDHPTLNIGRIDGGTNTNVVPDRVTFKLDRRMIPEEDPAVVEETLRAVIARALPPVDGLSLDIRRLLLANALKPLAGHERLVAAIVDAAGGIDAAIDAAIDGAAIDAEPLAVTATPLYTDARLYGEAGVPIVLFGAGPRSILDANAKRADENLVLADLERATRIVARALSSLLGGG